MKFPQGWGVQWVQWGMDIFWNNTIYHFLCICNKQEISLAVYSRSNVIGVTYISYSLTHSPTHSPTHPQKCKKAYATMPIGIMGSN